MRTKKVNPALYEVRESLTGLLAIQPVDSAHFGDGSVWGTDPGCEDHHNKELANSVLSEWDGTLVLDGDRWAIAL